ncbi:MAG: polysaccharide pyruvyl transferase family protein [Ruminococcaceae bacterium]|nr:polysaccharide pyruvyl transferase family protein [Oscillospiraceae bacterium]
MKIGLVTISQGENYGNRLQNYAMQEVFKKLGHSVETISYGEDVRVSAKRLLIHFFKANILKQKIHKLIKHDRFYLFNKRMINFSSTRYICGKEFDTSAYDLFVAGSDQIWNLYFKDIEEFRDFMFLTFVPKGKKIAYSSSLGTNNVPKQYEKFFKDAIKEFDNISVRESAGANAIKEYCGIDVMTTVDPTLMLSYKEWDSFSKKPKELPKKNYLVVYFISEISDTVKDYIDRVSKEHNLEVVILKAGSELWIQIPDERYFCADPKEFVYYIAHSKLVITDSFHASVFSIIFKRPFRIFERKDLDMSSRTKELFNKINIGKWCIGDANLPLNQAFECDYSGVDEAIKKEQKKAFDYLKKALKT